MHHMAHMCSYLQSLEVGLLVVYFTPRRQLTLCLQSFLLFSPSYLLFGPLSPSSASFRSHLLSFFFILFFFNLSCKCYLFSCRICFLIFVCLFRTYIGIKLASCLNDQHPFPHVLDRCGVLWEISAFPSPSSSSSLSISSSKTVGRRSWRFLTALIPPIRLREAGSSIHSEST